ncbi:hypothetical protein [Falsiroseomonas tokyonensis]|uniref:Galectin n=1 Tax=Falsiroseomonas tokyonensis TaxID=430521 RepID=A0ABV7BPA0_9PROT|nr:hypothetical protein [Falsiroseomonas tokyonensis]MBU8536414.1 hypothetical protein [Falsiroseomonas tokyonensis]
MALPGASDSYLFSVRAIRDKAHLDFIDGNDILFHAKPLQEHGWIVFNSFLGGAWQPEARLPLDPADFAAPIRLGLALGPGGLVLRVNDRPELDYPLDLARLAAARVRHGTSIAPILPAAEEQIAIRILAADIMHLAAEVTLPGGDWAKEAVQDGAAFLLSIDGRPAGRTPLAALRPAEGGTLPLRMTFGRGAFVCDGMVAELVLERQGQRWTLATAPLRSRFTGGLDRCNEAMVRGFAANPALPGQPVMVDVFINGTYQGSTRADRPRPDLAEFGADYAHSGFEFTFARPIHLPVSADAFVSVRVRDTDLDLANSPWWVCRAVTRDSLLQLEAPQPPARDAAAQPALS